MGVLDWLTESLGTSGGMTGGTPMMPGPGNMQPQVTPMGDPTGQQIPLPPGPVRGTSPMPPVQMTGQDAPMMPPANLEAMMGQGPPPGVMYPPAGDPMTAGGLPPQSPPMPPQQPPMPPQQARPTPPMPPGGGGGGKSPAEIIQSYQRAGGQMMTPGAAPQEPQARSFLGRALGLDPNRAAELEGSLSAGLKAAGANSNKGKGAAFMGSAGAAMEGGKAASDKIVDQQDKVVGRAIQSKSADLAATNAGFNNRLSEARTRLAEEQTKMAKAGGKDSVLNSEQQLYLRAGALVNNDQQVRAARTAYEKSAALDPESKETKAAKEALDKTIEAARAARYKEVGLDPKKAEQIGKQPGLSQENPHDIKGWDQKKIDALPPGSFIRTPDGKVLQKKAPAAPAAGANQPAPTQSMTPAVQPPVPPAVANARASMEADDEDE